MSLLQQSISASKKDEVPWGDIPWSVYRQVTQEKKGD